ncbi:type II toxin-antitoxin system RelE/ParE family toxin [Altererythrobacter sp.]|uniref:type II toxin-antitoxin system RelE/ParE family toxin n=1 Tax=Altererythrobacter sp. TaxID=1872480 RepID=UPI003D0F8544
MQFRLRAAARYDLADIRLLTADRWSVDRAEDYARAIEQRLRHIRDFPQHYPEKESRYGTFRNAPCGEHLIFYLIGEDVIDVVRILHNRVDVEGQFDR